MIGWSDCNKKRKQSLYRSFRIHDVFSESAWPTSPGFPSRWQCMQITSLVMKRRNVTEGHNNFFYVSHGSWHQMRPFLPSHKGRNWLPTTRTSWKDNWEAKFSPCVVFFRWLLTLMASLLLFTICTNYVQNFRVLCSFRKMTWNAVFWIVIDLLLLVMKIMSWTPWTNKTITLVFYLAGFLQNQPWRMVDNCSYTVTVDYFLPEERRENDAQNFQVTNVLPTLSVKCPRLLVWQVLPWKLIVLFLIALYGRVSMTVGSLQTADYLLFWVEIGNTLGPQKKWRSFKLLR